MEDDQQFCLRWNNHQSTLIQNFDTLLESGTLVDCTLAAEGKTLKAHKVVLSACSPYFECLLSEHYDKHPVFILKDVKFKELKAMMDYMYRGEVNISQDQLAALLKAAESLQIKGLSESKTAGSDKTESRPQKTVCTVQPTAPSLDIPHASSGLTIEKNKVPRQTQSSVGDIPVDTDSPQGLKRGLTSSSREGSPQSPISRKRKRFRRRSLDEENTIENQDASSSSDIQTQQQMGIPALGIAPVADEKTHADSADTLGRSALMTQLTKSADEMLQLPLEKPEPNDNLIEPKSEYEDPEEAVEDLTLDDDMNDLNDMEQDTNRAGPSHDPTQHPAGLGTWHITGDRSNAGGVVGSAIGAPGATDEALLAAQEAAQQAHRDSQGLLYGNYGNYAIGLYDSTKPDSVFMHEDNRAEDQSAGHVLDSAGVPEQIRGGYRASQSIIRIRRRRSGRRNHVCPKCGNGYLALKSLRRHLTYECGLKPRFKCPYCETRSKQRGHVSQHIRRKHSGQRIYIIDDSLC
ncbi:longitudinals lacking protein, isoforms A/B/D/L isoform X7 [Linepithema humile]|uniref:longitudinals lacking protein, isoforms A/B/D/L isoform X7 n=1 Tax=Linepithema humile TaxID=83485 RepID=UPI00351ECCE5